MKKIVEDLEKRCIEKYTIFKLDKPFLICWLDLKKLNINFPCAPYFQYITIEFWGSGYGVVFYDSKGEFVTYVGSGFAKEKNAIECFYELLLNISQLKGGEHNG